MSVTAEVAIIIRRVKIVVSRADLAMARRIESFICAYEGDDLLHDIELSFPDARAGASFCRSSATRRRAAGCASR
jgi:hypothetical protein